MNAAHIRILSNALTDVDLVLLRTAVLSTEGVVHTIAGTAGASRAPLLRAQRLLIRVGRPEWSDDPGLCEWLVTNHGKRVYATSPEGRTWTSP